MIDCVLQDFLAAPVEGLDILDIGCGNGDISRHFAARNRQVGVDISDRRRDRNPTFSFKLVNSERLPFPDQTFDIVISHHVIEHVDDQSLHLLEIHRVLRRRGVAYLATPNRSSPFMKGHAGNSRVLRYREMAPLFVSHGFGVHEYTVTMLREPRRFALGFHGGQFVPRGVLNALRGIIPSHVFILTPAPL